MNTGFVKPTIALAASLAAYLAAGPADAFGLDGPGLWASLPHYNQRSSRPLAGPFCVNTPAHMPAGRQFDCGAPVLTRIATGIYQIRVANGAPLPLVGARAFGNDSGYVMFTTPVGSNAICSENSTQVLGIDLVTTIYCVTPGGSNVDTDFSWFYRTDSSAYAQIRPHPLNLIYGRVNAANPSQFVEAETFNPFPETMSSTKLATGRYRVTFNNVNPQSSDLDIEQTTGMNNVIVQRSCSNDASNICKTASCIPFSWSNGTGGEGSNLTVEVRCYAGTQAADMDFRVLVANESHSSQGGDGPSMGMHYGWADSPTFTANGQCRSSSQILHRSQHETPVADYPTLPMQTCRPMTGTYRNTFNLSFYHEDAPSVLISSRGTQGVYCNAARIDCGNDGCSATPPLPFVDVRCYDRSGNVTNALWNLSILY